MAGDLFETDIVTRLRSQGADAFSQHFSLGMWKLCAEAADEIKRLRAALEAAGVAELIEAVAELDKFLDFESEWNACGCFPEPDRLTDAMKAMKAALAKAIGSPSDDARAAHRAAVEAGYASLAGYVETHGKGSQ